METDSTFLSRWSPMDTESSARRRRRRKVPAEPRKHSSWPTSLSPSSSTTSSSTSSSNESAPGSPEHWRAGRDGDVLLTPIYFASDLMEDSTSSGDDDAEGRGGLPSHSGGFKTPRDRKYQGLADERHGEEAKALGEDFERRGRLLRQALLSWAAVSGLYAASIFLIDGRITSPIGCISFANVNVSLALWFYLTCGVPSSTGHGLNVSAILFAVQISMSVLFSNLFYFAQPFADSTHWLVFIPLYLLYIMGRRAGVIALIVAVIQAGLILFLTWLLADESGAFATCSMPPPIWNIITTIFGRFDCDTMSSHFHVSAAGRALSMISFVLCVGVVSFAYEDTRRSTLFILQQNNERLHRATLAKAQFLANMTHELRTPMHGIISMAKELLESAQLDVKGREAAQIISDSSDHLLSLVNDILDFESLEAGQLKLEHIPFSLSKETSKVVNLLAVLAQQKDIKLEKNLSIHHDLRKGDPLRFRQILYNLLSNAIKFTPECGQVSVIVVDETDDTERIRVEVHDTGIGIQESYRDSLFKVYSQSGADIRRKFGGSGLGLAICKGLCDAMGGDIWCESVPGEGTTFISELFLPHSVEECDFDDDKQAGEVAKVSTPGLVGARVLLVEDNAVSQKVGVKILSKLGVNVKVASDGSECLNLVKRERFDVILMDCQMPVMDGFEATRNIRDLEASGQIPLTPRRVRAQQRNLTGSEETGTPQSYRGTRHASESSPTLGPARKQSRRNDHHSVKEEAESTASTGIPVIALTASATIDVQHQCFQSGMDDFLQKPFRKEELERILREWTYKPSSSSSSSASTSDSDDRVSEASS